MITSHSWGDAGSQQRLQALGGVVGPISSQANHYVQEWQAARANRNPEFLFGVGYGSDINGLRSQPVPRPDAASNPVDVPVPDVRRRQHDPPAGLRHPHLRRQRPTASTTTACFPDWIEDLRQVGGDQIVDDIANGAEAYLQLWERTEAAAD